MHVYDYTQTQQHSVFLWPEYIYNKNTNTTILLYTDGYSWQGKLLPYTHTYSHQLSMFPKIEKTHHILLLSV